jgi:hypothetical protein
MGDCNKEYPESNFSVFFFPALRFQFLGQLKIFWNRLQEQEQHQELRV